MWTFRLTLFCGSLYVFGILFISKPVFLRINRTKLDPGIPGMHNIYWIHLILICLRSFWSHFVYALESYSSMVSVSREWGAYALHDNLRVIQCSSTETLNRHWKKGLEVLVNHFVFDFFWRSWARHKNKRYFENSLMCCAIGVCDLMWMLYKWDAARSRYVVICIWYGAMLMGCDIRVIWHDMCVMCGHNVVIDKWWTHRGSQCVHILFV